MRRSNRSPESTDVMPCVTRSDKRAENAASTSMTSIEPNDFGTVAVAVTSDVDEQAALLIDWTQRYHQISPGEFSGSLSQVCFDGVQLMRETTTQRVHQEGVASPNSLVVVVPLVL